MPLILYYFYIDFTSKEANYDNFFYIKQQEWVFVLEVK